MKRFFLAAAIAVATLSPQAQAADVGVSVSVGQPGFYGRLDVGGYPAPALLYPQPVMIQRVPVGRAPLYLRVPPGHAKHWRKHCHSYRACGEQVYFVRDDWYAREYAPRYREQHGNHRGYERSNYRNFERNDYRRDDRHERRGHDRHERNDRHDKHDRGHGHGGRDH